MRTEYKEKNIAGLITGAGMAGMAELHSPPPGVQAVPGSILDKAPFFSIVDLGHFTVRLSTSGAQEHKAGGTLQYGDH